MSLSVQNPLITFIALTNSFSNEGNSQQASEFLAFEEMFAQVQSLSVEDQVEILNEMDCWCKDHFNQFIDGIWGEQSPAFWNRKKEEKADFIDFMERVSDHTWNGKIPTDFGDWLWCS